MPPTDTATHLLQYRARVAPPSRQLKPGADKALARLRAVQKELARWDERRAKLDAGRAAVAAKRAEAITACLDAGYTFRTLGEELDLTPQRVQQMRATK